MANESKRELIMQNLKTALESINGSGSYWTDVKAVKRVPFIPQDMNSEQKPGLLIVATGEPESIESQHGWHDKRTMLVGVVGVMDRPENDEGTAVNRFMQDVGIAAVADVTRGGLASMTRKTYQQDISSLFGDICAFEIELAITYHCDGRTEQ